MLKLKDYELKASTIRDVVRVQSALGDKIALIVDGESISFANIHKASNQVANSLAQLGIAKGDVVATYMFNSIDHVVLWFACAKLGAIWAPMNIALINVDLAYTISNANPKALIVDEDLLKNYIDVRDRISPEIHIEVLRSASAQDDLPWRKFSDLYRGAIDDPKVEVSWNDEAGLIFTGGSTGLPKGVLVSNAWYFPGVFRYREMFDPSSQDVHMGLGQLYHTIGSAVDVLCPFYFGITTVLSKWFSASRFWDLVETHQATISVIIGPAIIALMGQPERAEDRKNSIRIIGTGTGGMPRDIVEGFARRFGIDILELYGQTETGPLGCISQRVHDRPYHSLGTANGWADVMVGDCNGVGCPPNTVGEIMLRPRYPSTFMRGYFNKPEKFAEVCRDLWFHTGDYGHLDERGYLHYDGRIAHMIRRRGESIAAIEVEQIILSHSAVLRCGVIGVPSPSNGDEDVKACIQLRAEASLDPLQLVKYCEERIAYFKVPRYVEFFDELPVTASKNEVERHKLKERGVGAAWDRDAIGYSVKRRL